MASDWQQAARNMSYIPWVRGNDITTSLRGIGEKQRLPRYLKTAYCPLAVLRE